MPECTPPPTIYLAMEASKSVREQNWEEEEEEGAHVGLPSTRESSHAWAAGPVRQPLYPPQTQAALFGLAAFSKQAASFCVGVKRPFLLLGFKKCFFLRVGGGVYE